MSPEITTTVNSTERRAESPAIPDNDTITQVEPHLPEHTLTGDHMENVSNQGDPQTCSPERTTAADITGEVTKGTEPRPTASPWTAESNPLAQEEPTKPDPPTQDNRETRRSSPNQTGEPHNDAPTGPLLSPDKDTVAEPNIRAILEED